MARFMTFHTSPFTLRKIFCLIFFLPIVSYATTIFPASRLSVSSLLKKFHQTGESASIVIQSKLIEIQDTTDIVFGNGSISEYKKGYLLVFRADSTKKCKACGYSKPLIKYVLLNKFFNVISSIKTISHKGFVPEDARLHMFGGELYLTFNDEIIPHRHVSNKRLRYSKRRMFIAKFDPERGCLSDITRIPSGGLSLSRVEKNWTPFEYPHRNGFLYYIYSTNPLCIIEIDKKIGVASNLYNVNQPKIKQIWNEQLWGEIRGGTPARKVDDFYLTFFHSWKKDPIDKAFYYVMGAYIFESKPPFKILAITPSPIFFKDIYTAQHRQNYLNVIYPSGFTIEKKKDKTVLHVSCGENDTSIRIVSIDKDALLQSMVKVN